MLKPETVKIGQKVEILGYDGYVLDKGNIISVSKNGFEIEIKTQTGKINLVFIKHYNGWKYGRVGHWSLYALCYKIELS